MVLLLLIGQFLLAARQFFELGKRLFDLFLALLRRRGVLAGFELVLLAVQLEIKQALEVTACASGPAAALVTESYLNIAESGFGARKMLE